MKPDLKTLDIGDSVVLRCNGKIEVEDLKIFGDMVQINFNNWDDEGMYRLAGEHPFDIVSIERKST